jgi:hypothetical protein
VEAPGIEPGSENIEANGVYVRVPSFVSSRFALTDKLAPGLVTCLGFASAPVTRDLASQFVDGLPKALAGPRSTGFQTCCLGSESDCVVVRNCVSREVFTWSHETHGTQQLVEISVEADRPHGD